MYRLNPLSRNVLIMTDEVVAKAPVNGDVDPRMLQNSIELAEERFIVPLLGEKMYSDFVAMKNTVVTSGNKALLQTQVNLKNTGTTINLVEGQIINAIEFVSNSTYADLWSRFLWRLCAECVAFTAIPTNAIRTTSQGEMANNPAGLMGGEGAQSVNAASLKFKMDKIMSDRVDPMIAATKNWLCTNRSNTDLQLWDASGCPGQYDQASPRRSGFVFGLYDKIDNPKRC